MIAKKPRTRSAARMILSAVVLFNAVIPTAALASHDQLSDGEKTDGAGR
jgi:hypothetical protein